MAADIVADLTALSHEYDSDGLVLACVEQYMDRYSERIMLDSCYASIHGSSLGDGELSYVINYGWHGNDSL